MSMMDVMNQAGAGAGGQPPAPEAAAPPQGGEPPKLPEEGMRMADGDPKEMQALYTRVMSLISEEIWEKNGADQVAEQLNQDDSQPAEIIGKFTGFYLMMAVSAAKSKGGMLPPVIVAAAAGETASQLTDLALMFKMVSPDQADDTADAAALVGLEVLLQNAGQSMTQDEHQEYVDVTKALIDASPQAEQMAGEVSEDAIEDVQDMQGMGNDDELPDEEGGDEAAPPQQGSGMAAAMGGV